jgi:PAS domain S-box-containing protein
MHGRSDASAPEVAFLRGGGEMGALTRAHDWASTSLGAPETWPGSLKTAVRLILNTGHPMYIWWGPDLLCFYNDAYRRTLGPERHPGSLGRPGREVWAEIWHLIGHQVDFVMAGRGSTWDENRAVPITRFGRLDEIYWTYSYSPIDDETVPNGVGGVLVVCTETTQAVLAERRRAADAERQRRLFEQAPGFITILTGPEHVFEFVNASYDRLFARRGFVGKTVREAFPELNGQGFYELLDRVYATGERFVASAMLIRLRAGPEAEPTDRFLDFIYEPVRDEGGAITGIFVEGYDVTERVRAEMGLRDAEERYLALFNRIDQGFCTIEVAFDEHDVPVDYRFLEVSPSFERQTGIENGEGRWMREIAADQDQFWFDTYGRVALTGEPARFESYSTPLGRWWDVYAFRISGPRRIAVLFRDITDQKRAEAALRESEARFRHMADSAPALIWMSDEEGQVTFANMHYEHMFGRPAAEMLGGGWAQIVLPDDLERHTKAFFDAFHARIGFHCETRVIDKAGQVRWLRCEGVPRFDDAGRFLGYTGCNIDITASKVAEERRDLLINELNHRVKNTLATVQSIASQTLRNAPTPQEAKRALEERLFALSRAHDVLTRENWEGANIREIVAQAVEPYSSRGEDRLHLSGPRVRLPPRMALALAMALQELATNAVKYGALSNATGGIGISWSIDATQDPARLHLRWTETGGPPVQAPTRRGFGSRLIERSLADDLAGQVQIEFAPTGVTCTVDAPITHS